jgi:hypothetical protein
MILKIVENNTKQSGLDCLSFFLLDFVSAMPRISLSLYTLTFLSFCAIPISFLQLQILQMNLSTCCVAFRWHHTVEISSKIR